MIITIILRNDIILWLVIQLNMIYLRGYPYYIQTKAQLH